jgi:hypothetical protein
MVEDRLIADLIYLRDLTGAGIAFALMQERSPLIEPIAHAFRGHEGKRVQVAIRGEERRILSAHLTTAFISNLLKAFSTASGRKRTARPMRRNGTRREATHPPTVRTLT